VRIANKPLVCLDNAAGVAKTTVIATVGEVPLAVRICFKSCLKRRPEIKVRLTVGLLLRQPKAALYLNVRKFPFLELSPG
jgi:hypothetical protein